MSTTAAGLEPAAVRPLDPFIPVCSGETLQGSTGTLKGATICNQIALLLLGDVPFRALPRLPLGMNRTQPYLNLSANVSGTEYGVALLSFPCTFFF